MTVRRVHTHHDRRAGEPDWEQLSQGARVDECFPEYNGIGSHELLDELGLSPVYVLLGA
ncbi:MAG: hypothetical protein QM809_14560 [Gordonia sp. (in: high G+C Gram-positive bacteria)]|uniref:hypothetical protein n=1 Tax=Gordonia sp. (in: high G+C Gram-positive bacteria) TaxID=84139 RepID=UPI0039E4326B